MKTEDKVEIVMVIVGLLVSAVIVGLHGFRGLWAGWCWATGIFYAAHSLWGAPPVIRRLLGHLKKLFNLD